MRQYWARELTRSDGIDSVEVSGENPLRLGAHVFENGCIPFMLRDRLLEPAELYQNQKAPKTFSSGDHGQINFY
jgi:hypothetical protein